MTNVVKVFVPRGHWRGAEERVDAYFDAGGAKTIEVWWTPTPELPDTLVYRVHPSEQKVNKK
jgi:hypothetical protein